MQHQHSPTLSEKIKEDNSKKKNASPPKEDEIVESIEAESGKVKESDKELYKNLLKDGMHNFPFESLQSDGEESEEEMGEKGALKRKREDEGEEVREEKRVKRKALWEGFGGEGEFELNSGRLYDPKEWNGKDW